ncbi:serine/arginine repetitive matrix protein 2-like isoform X2 [Scylla paramamosain]|uniref:serine/arginine repetitive matrix protein 2-like isoform X2 n=1 Tax=Scylla paramamosain TaxID=85552 RepID=UPI003082E5A7
MIVCTSYQEERHIVQNEGGGGSVSVATCEHRFSSSGGAPPPYSRLPPDGHEFPSNYAEGLPDKMSRYARYSRLAMELDSPGSPPPSATTPRTRSAPGTPLGPPPPIPRSSPTASKTYSSDRTLDSGNNKWTGNEERKSREQTPTRSRWRRQDERSEKSVRDKIAMFSTDGPDQPHPKTRKLDKQESEEGTMKRSFTEDDVRLDNSASSNSKSGREPHSSSRSLSKTSVFSSMINVSTSEPKDNTKHMSTASSEVDIRQDTPPTPRSHGMREEKRDDESSSSGLHSRSQSLIDIGRTSLTKRHSVGAYDRPSVYQYGIEKPEERERRTSLTNLIEQRRKSFGSKLLGLVIPESRGSEGSDKASIDLPRISSVPPTTASKTMSLPREGQRSPRLYKADSISSIDSCESNTSRHSSLNAPPWKSHGTSTLPKYSPAFKRKNMSVFSKSDNLPPLSGRSHSACSTSPTSDLSQPSPTPPCHSPPKSLETISPPSSEHTYDMNDGRYNSDRHSYSKLPLSQKNSYESRHNRAEDSDNDSAVSSTQSSYSQGMSPPSSPMPEQDELEDRRGRGYRSRLSQQNSLDDQDAARRVLKRGSIEAENRRNVINSARCSSGRNSDEHQTPEIIRKYSSSSDRGEDSDRFPNRLDSELREGPKVTGLRRQASTSSTSSTASSRRSSHDSSRRNSKDSVIHVTKYDEAKVSAEPVYFDQEGEMYKESQLKVAYVNEITDDFEQLNECNNKDVIAEVQLSSPPSRRTTEASDSSDTSQGVPSNPRRGNRWAELEMKYGSTNSTSDIESKIQRMRRASDSSSPDHTKKNSGGFRALAEKWQQRAEEDTAAPPQPNLARRESNGRLEASVRSSRQYEERSATTSTQEKPTRPSRLYDNQSDVDGAQPAQSDLHSESTQSSSNSLSSSGDTRAENLDIPRAEVPDRKLSMPEYGNGGVKMRDRREGGTGGAPSRPTSLIEGGDGGVMDSNYLTGCSQLSPTASTDSRDDLFTPETSLSRTSSKEVLDAFSRPRANIGISFPRVGASTTPKIDDIMRAFERHDMRKRGGIGAGSSHPRMSSLDSTNSDEGLIGAHYGSVTSLASGQRDQYGSITSLASSTSLISPQELAQLIEEANQSLEESGTPSHEILVVVLHREIVGHGSIGITLAGGADYETKEITVHKVIPGSLADRDGRIQRGDRVLSINGKNLRGVSHKEALSILKSPRPEVVLVLSRSRSVTPQESNMTESDGNFIHRPSLINHVTSPRPPKILESPMDSKSLISDVAAMSVPRGPPFTITLVKDGAGLGFSLEGGKDSPLGDRPLTVKKIFSGGAADKGGILKVGDELVSVNAVDVTGMARIEAWNFLKKLPDGTVTLVLRQKLDGSSAKNEE